MNFTKKQIWGIAMAQSAVDAGCRKEDFLAPENVIVQSRKDPGARKYLELPFDCDLTSYGGSIVASVSEQCRSLVAGYISRFPPERCFETPALHVLMDALEPLGLKVCFMAEYFLPDPALLRAPECPYELRLLGPEDFSELYTPAWGNALCEKRKELDVLGVGAFDGGKLVGLAGCSADCAEMWQIGVDVLPGWRGQGLSSALTGRLALEILERGKIPFYCAAWSNVKSVRSALSCGFRPAWVELTAKSAAFVEDLNRQRP